MEIPNVDIITKKITGCLEKTPEHLHEEGHLAFQQTNFGSTLQWLFESSQMYMLGSLSLSFFIPFFKYISVGLFIFMIFCLIYEEYWCEEWAKKEMTGRVNVIERVT